MARQRKIKESKKEIKARQKTEANPFIERTPTAPVVTQKTTVVLPKIMTVRELGQFLRLPLSEVMTVLIKNGLTLTLNESIDFDTAALVADELNFEAKPQLKEKQDLSPKEGDEKIELKPRPAVVTVMGHIDHGKSALIERIRQIEMLKHEAGGITQNIGAYQVKIKNKIITFIDTPGHEAFSEMRSHGANITDIVLLVVAANEGVMPQTKEALSHALAAKVPIISVITKIDLHNADIEATKRSLTEVGLTPEEWGGTNPTVVVSAKTGQGIDELLELITLVADLKEYKARLNGPAVAVVIESNKEKERGNVATVLVKEGTLKVNDYIIMENAAGKIRNMEDGLGKKVLEAGPSTPVLITGLTEMAEVGAILKVVKSAKEAKGQIQSSQERKVNTILKIQQTDEGIIFELPLILKTNVAGLLKAIQFQLEKLATAKSRVKIVHEAVGEINESDVNLAKATEAVVFGFQVKTSPMVAKLAERLNVPVFQFAIIYELLDQARELLAGVVKPQKVYEEKGKLEVLEVFLNYKQEKIIGGKVLEGCLTTGGRVRVIRNDEEAGRGKVVSLKKGNLETTKVEKNDECGLKIALEPKIRKGDILIFEEESTV
ncbi:translation initiation factor IF-2 [Candidatus Berkelbacteria bacterium]|nr:translation initiation factor IF-2 [Candidatus Berkelbacteria bacterium]